MREPGHQAAINAPELSRRRFLRQASLACGVSGLAGGGAIRGDALNPPGIELGVHHYSVRSLFRSGTLTLTNFPNFARESLGVSNVEIAAELSSELLRSESLVQQMKAKADEASVRILTLLCSGETALDADTESERNEAIKHHLEWIAVARSLGCRYIRIRAGLAGDSKERLKKAISGIGELHSRMQSGDPRLLVENVGALSRNPEWLLDLVTALGKQRCGVLADYGNFNGDIYDGMRQLLPVTESLCTKSWDFDSQGREKTIDFSRMGALIKEAGFQGCISIEYLGKNLNGTEGVKKTASLVRASLR